MQPSSLRESVDKYYTFAHTSTATLSIGGALLLAGIITYVTAPDREEVTLTPVVGLGHLGLAGRF